MCELAWRVHLCVSVLDEFTPEGLNQGPGLFFTTWFTLDPLGSLYSRELNTTPPPCGPRLPKRVSAKSVPLKTKILS